MAAPEIARTGRLRLPPGVDGTARCSSWAQGPEIVHVIRNFYADYEESRLPSGSVVMDTVH
jgi:hypothetical protein